MPRLTGPWPYKDPAPRFTRALGAPIDLVEVWNEMEMHRLLAYPLNHPIPDYLGIDRQGRGILWECKTTGKTRRALEQLEAGLEWFRAQGRRIDLLGIKVGRLDGKGPWRRTMSGELAMKSLGDIPVERGGLRIMVEERGDG